MIMGWEFYLVGAVVGGPIFVLFLWKYLRIGKPRKGELVENRNTEE